jgi:serine phosphatase RsbU (regulator of sigma subunit)
VVDQRKTAEASARRSEAARAERRLWQTVEQGLLPESLPALPGLRLAARYLPSSPGLAIGGDFYDARVLPDGRLAVMVGDVAGHGAESAARAARMRFGWGALVEVDPDPRRVLEIMNTHIAEPHEREKGVYATMCHCIVSPDGTAEFALAGHPRPLVVTGGDAALVEVDGRGPILGLLDEVEWPVSTVHIPRGGMMVIYTDGLVEARRGDEIFGWQRAAEALDATAGSSLEARIAYLTEAAQRYDEGNLRDDVAVLAVQVVGR